MSVSETVMILLELRLGRGIDEDPYRVWPLLAR